MGMLDLLKHQLLDLEERLNQTPHPPTERTAAFDLDGTLLMGDIGDAVFAYLALEDHRLALSWGDYQRLLRTHKSKAYRATVEAMAGLTVETVVRATSAVMSFGLEYLHVHSDVVRIPRPRPLLSQFVALLQQLHYTIFVISASNHISVQHVARQWFNIPSSHAFGIQSTLQDGRITPHLVEPVPIGPGKAALFKYVAGPVVPLVTGTDSRLDIPLLQLTHPQGLSLWVGENQIDFNVVMQNAREGQRFFFVESGEEAESDGF
jgi:phosphoserine phosphatase